MQFLIDLLPGLGLAVLAIIALVCTVVYRAAQRLHRLRWRSVQARTLPRDEIPEPTRLQLDQLAGPLQAAGFIYRYSGATGRAIALPGDRWAYSDIYQHADGQTHAVVTPSQTPETSTPCVTQLVSCFADGSNWTTVNCYHHQLPFTQPGWQVFDDYLSDFAQVFARHGQRILASGKPVIDDGLEVRKRLMTAPEKLVPLLVRQGKLLPLPGGGGARWHLSWKAAFEVVIKVQRGHWRAAKAGNRVGPAVTSVNVLTADEGAPPRQGG